MQIKTVLLLGCLGLSACSSQNRTLPFFDPQGELQQMAFSVSADGKQPLVTIADRTLLLQQQDGRKLMLRINGQDHILVQPVRQSIGKLEFYELGQGGFVDVYRADSDDLCRRFARNQALTVEHALTFYQQNAQAQPRLFGIVSNFDLQQKQVLSKLNSSKNIPASEQDYTELLQGSARKLHSFLANVICR